MSIQFLYEDQNLKLSQIISMVDINVESNMEKILKNVMLFIYV